MALDLDTHLVPIVSGTTLVVALGIGLGVLAVSRLASAPGAADHDEAIGELLRNVEAIRGFENTLVADGLDDYRDCGTEDRARAEATVTPRAWEPERCWGKIGFEPEAPVRGGYWVELVGAGFAAHGVVDADGDGVWAHVRATEIEPAGVVSEPGVF